MYTVALTINQIKRVIAHVELASKDTTLPALNAVQIVAEGDTLTIRSTDRYILGESTITAEGAEGEAVNALIPAADITGWKQLTKTGQIFRLTLNESTWTLDTHSSKVTGSMVNADYPSVSRLFPEDRLLHPIRPSILSVVNMDKLGKFARAAGVPTSERRWNIGQASTEGRAPIVALIEGTRVLVMPIINYSNPDYAPEGYRFA